MTEKEFWDSIGSVYEAEKVDCLDCIVATYSGMCSSYATCGDAIRALFYLYVEDKKYYEIAKNRILHHSTRDRSTDM